MTNQQQLSLAALVAGMISAQSGVAQAQAVVVSWIQEGPGSSAAALQAGSYGDQPTSLVPTILARSIVSDGVCPTISIDGGTASTMSLRVSANQLTNVPGGVIGGGTTTNNKAGYPQYFVSPTATAPASFPNGTAMATTSWAECEFVVPGGHKTAVIEGTSFKLPVAAPHHVLVLADTGCRMNGALASNGSNQQNCSNPTAFPTAYLSGFEASEHPDVIVHAGDYFYRDTNCLTNNAETFPGCNTPSSVNYETWGDTWDSWNADVFYPMKSLLETAPVVLARGNHESCGRGARGWFALLDPHPYNFANVSCLKTVTYPTPSTTPIYTPDFTPSYVVNAGSFNFIVHDGSFANDSAVDKGMAANYDLDLTNMVNTLGANSMNIFVTHKPIFGLVYGSDGPAGKKSTDNSGDFTEQSVFAGGTSPTSAFVLGVPASIGLFLSGHIHQSQYVNFDNYAQFPPQMIVGMSGSLLDPDMNTGVVPAGDLDIASFNQTAATFTLNTFSGVNQSTVANHAGSHDEFGFALLDAVTKGSTVTGFNALVYKVGLTQAGKCKIVFSPRKLSCNY